MNIRRVLLAFVSVVSIMALHVGASAAVAAADARSPEDTVKQYLGAMKANKFPEAYQYVSTTLRAGKDREAWAKEQQYIVQMGEVKIFGYQVFDAVLEGDKAKVPNILKSQDKYLNQLGLDEHEIYILIREDGEWRIDQQTLVQGAERTEYFPDE